MGRKDPVEFSRSRLQMLQAKNICLHIPVQTKHENLTIDLDWDTADEAPLLSVQKGNAAGCMSRHMDYFQFPLSQVNDISLKHRKNPSFLMEHVMVEHHLRRVHHELGKLNISAGMVGIGTGIDQHHRFVSYFFCRLIDEMQEV